MRAGRVYFSFVFAAVMAAAPAFAQDLPGVTKTEELPAPQHTGFGAFVRTTASDFVAFPKRPSTWVILGIGAGSALLALGQCHGDVLWLVPPARARLTRRNSRFDAPWRGWRR